MIKVEVGALQARCFNGLYILCQPYPSAFEMMRLPVAEAEPAPLERAMQCLPQRDKPYSPVDAGGKAAIHANVPSYLPRILMPKGIGDSPLCLGRGCFVPAIADDVVICPALAYIREGSLSAPAYPHAWCPRISLGDIGIDR